MGDRPTEATPDRDRPVGLVVGVVVSIALVAGLLLWVGPAAVLGELAGARPGPALLAVAATVVSIACRHAAYLTLYRSVDAGPGGVRFHLLILFAGVPRWVLPAGYVGGPAINGFYLSRGVGARFGPTVAALAVVEFLAVVASFVVVLAGVGLLVATGSPVPGSTLATAGGVVAVGLAGTGLVVVGVRSKRVAGLVARSWTGLRATFGRLGPTRYLRRVTGDGVSGRIRGFLRSLGTVTARRRRVYLAFLLSGAGWFVGVTTLYFCLHAVNAPAPVGVAMVAVPVSGVAGVVPLPAGVGSTELALTAVVVGLAGTAPEAAAAAVVLFRLATVGLELGAGGVAGAVLAAMGRRPDPV